MRAALESGVSSSLGYTTEYKIERLWLKEEIIGYQALYLFHVQSPPVTTFWLTLEEARREIIRMKAENSRCDRWEVVE